MTKKRIIVSCVLYAVTAILVIGLIVGTCVANSYKSIISIYFNQDITKVVSYDENGNEVNVNYYESEFANVTELTAAQDVFASDLQAEGAVLLRNENKTLPLKSNERKVTLLGTSSVDYLYGGAGAGAIDATYSPSMKKVFEDAGYTVNGKVWDFYASGEGKKYRRNHDYTGFKVGEAPVEKFSQAELASFDEYKDAAIIVIGRLGAEGGDMSMTTVENAAKHSLELSDNELGLIKLANEKFAKTIVLLNTQNPVELGPIEELNVDACLWIGSGGQTGLRALPKILSGDLYPSGRLIDTYAYDNLSAPAMRNFGDYKLDGSNSQSKNSPDTYVWYGEGIYVGYKYYETRYADVVLGAENTGDFDYATAVQYPFGYGMSYTDFEYSGYAMKETGDNFEISLKVKNTGEYAGKEVVQIYMQSPYTAYDKTNGVEKSAVELVGFAKTKELAKNETADVTVTVPKEVMRAYDANSAKTYIVDEDTYYFAAGNNAHDALNNILAAQNKTTADGMDQNGDASLVKTYEQAELDTTTYATAATENKITNRFDDADIRYYDEYKDTVYLSRSDWEGTFPAPLTNTTVSTGRGEAPGLTATAQMIADMQIGHRYADDDKAALPVTSSTKTAYKLIQLKDKAYGDPMWSDLMDQLTAEEMMTLVRLGGYSTAPIKSIAKDKTNDKDGPAGISNTLIGGAGCYGYPIESLVAATWNVEIAERLGEFVGEDGLYSNTHGWYAPSMNIHRTPFSGRNFEYFSEDGFISGKFGAAIVKGAQSKGLYCYIKHFAFNDQETNRGGIATFLNEQSAREIYLRPFEMSIREGKASAIMVAMNRVGTAWVGAHKGLLTDVTRGEWGFEGMTITDQASFPTSYITIEEGLVAGLDLMLNTNADLWKIDGYDKNPTVMTNVRRAAKNILFTVVNSAAMNGISIYSEVLDVMPPWQIALTVVDVVVWTGGAAAVFFITFSLIRARKKTAFQAEEK